MNTVDPIRDLSKIEAMKKILKAGNIRDWLLLCLGINSALRVSDLLRLRQCNCFDERGRVLDSIRIREKKTSKEKCFRLNASARKALEEYVKQFGHDPESYLFKSRKGINRAISRSQAWEILTRAAMAVGIKDNIGTHTLRKTFAYHAYRQGTDIALLMRVLNHSSQAETLRYIGIQQDQIDDVYIATCL
jgi:site-specific recombinase XerD